MQNNCHQVKFMAVKTEPVLGTVAPIISVTWRLKQEN